MQRRTRLLNGHHNHRHQHAGPMGRRPVWFMGILVFVSVMAYMFRFREAETDLILRFQEDNGQKVSSGTRGRGSETQRRNGVSRLEREIINTSPEDEDDKEEEDDAVSPDDIETEPPRESEDETEAPRESDDDRAESTDSPQTSTEDDDEEQDDDDDDDDNPSRDTDDGFVDTENTDDGNPEPDDYADEEEILEEVKEEEVKVAETSAEDKDKKEEPVEEGKTEPTEAEEGSDAKDDTTEETRNDDGFGGESSYDEKKRLEEAKKKRQDVKKDEKTEELVSDHRPVYFLNHTVLRDEKDAFSASWLQRTEDFLTMDLKTIGICEDAAFRAYRRSRKEMLSETADWLDFSLEHMSKWWKILNIFEQKEIYISAIEKFSKYIANGAKFPVEKDPAFKQTIAVIAFQAYNSDKEQEQAFQLTLTSLGATVESLRRAGFGRVVVVGNGEKDKKASKETFQYLKRTIDGKQKGGDVGQVGHMEVAFAEFAFEDAKTQWLEKNIPRAALFGLKNAFDFAEKEEKERTEEESEYIKTWLGKDHEASYWEYVYLTEPDSVLQTRPSTLAALKEEVDKGKVLIPHRLQPIPHESDVRGSTKDWLFLPAKGHFENVIELDSIGEGDACCDQFSRDSHPGITGNFTACGNFWYMCDFNRRVKAEDRTYDRLRPYDLIRLKQGTEIVSLASLEHGRQCIPKKNAVCKPPHIHPVGSLFLEQS